MCLELMHTVGIAACVFFHTDLYSTNYTTQTIEETRLSSQLSINPHCMVIEHRHVEGDDSSESFLGAVSSWGILYTLHKEKFTSAEPFHCTKVHDREKGLFY